MNSCSGGSIRRMMTGRPVIASNRPSKSLRWYGNSSSRAAVRSALVLARIMRCTMGRRIGLEEHVLGAAQADAEGAESAGAAGVRRVVGVGPHLQAAGRASCSRPATRLPGVAAISSAHPSRVIRSVCSSNFGATVGIWPTNASPVPPSTLIHSPSLTTTPSAVMVRASMSILMLAAPTTHGRPNWRATTAAWLVAPPSLVRIPLAAIMPCTSSGLVKGRTMTTGPSLAFSSARSASK